MIYNYFSSILSFAGDGEYELVYISYDSPHPEQRRKLEALGFTVYQVTKKHKNLFKSCTEVYCIFKKHHINIVHSHMTVMSFLTSFIGILTGARTTISHAHLALYPKGVKKLLFAFYKLLNKLFSSHWLACGEAAGRFLYGDKAFDAGKVTVVNNAVDPTRFAFNPQARQNIQALHGIGNRFCIGNAGRFTPQKNHAFLIDVFSEIHKKQPDSVLLLMGDGPLFEEVRKKVTLLGLTDSVIFTGSVPNVNEYFSALDIFVLPSLYEGLAVVLIEAQFSGVPTVVSDTVTPEANVTGELEYLSLLDGKEVWARKILSKRFQKRGSGNCDAMRASGYDINEEAKKLDSLYSSAVTS